MRYDGDNGDDNKEPLTSTNGQCSSKAGTQYYCLHQPDEETTTWPSRAVVGTTRINMKRTPQHETFSSLDSSIDQNNLCNFTESNHRRNFSQQLPTSLNWSDEIPTIQDDMSNSLLPCRSNHSQHSHPLDELQRRYLSAENRAVVRQFIRKFGNYVGNLSLLTMLVVVPIVLYRALSNRKLDRAAYHSSIVMVIGTIVLSVRLVYLHLTHWYMPDVQKYVVRMLWMVPLYSVQSYLSLRYHHARIYMSTIRDFYESYVIASFVYYLMELLGGQDALVELLREKDPTLGHHSFPISLILEPWRLGTEFMLQCKHGVLQYVVFKTIATIVTFVCEFNGVYGEGRFNWFVAYPYLCFFQNVSVVYALYCLVIMFHAVQDELRNPVDWHPLGKFLCIKGVVFFTWWQGVLIFYLRDHGIIDKMGSWSSIDVANGLIDYCIVIEMVGFAIAHSYTFTYKECLPGRLPEASTMDSNMCDNENCTYPLVSSPDGELCRSLSQTYHPPATLNQPMGFKDAFWSSTLPKETLQDIKKLRAGIPLDGVLTPIRRRSFDMTEINRGEDRNNDDDQLVPCNNQESLERAKTMHL